MAGKFGQQVKELNELYQRRQEAIFRNSSQAVMTIANTPVAQGGRMPVVSGYLRNSNAASTSGVPSSADSNPSLVFATMRIGQTVWAGWTAAYALRQEYGFFGQDSLGRTYAQAGRAFLRTALQQWPQIVQRATADANARIR